MSYRRRQDSEGELPKLYSIHLSEVCSIQAYGVFVKIPGYRKNGLVHKSQMSNNKVEHPDDVAEMGDRVYCKVISIDNETAKIGMSMKVVNQSTGKDLDPGQVQTSQDEQRRKTGHVRGTPRIELGAVLDTVCKKCGGRGHLSKDCFHKPGSKSYDILPDMDYQNAQDAPERGDTDRHHKKRKKEKKSKKKKHKKEKKKRRKESSDSDSDSDRKSKKKRKRRQSSSDSSDSDGSDSDAGSDDNDQSWKRRRHDSGPADHGSSGFTNRSQYHSPEGLDRKRGGDRNNDARRRSLGDEDRGFRQSARSGQFSNENERDFDRGASRRDPYQGARHDGKGGFDRRESGDGFPGQRKGDNRDRRGEERYPEQRRRDNFSKRN